MSSTTLKTILEDFVEEYALGKLGTTTATGDTTSLIDGTRFAGPFSGNEYGRGEMSPIRITARAAVAGGGITVGSNVWISDYDPTTGDFTVSPATDDTAEIGASFIVMYPGVCNHTDRLVEAANRFLTRYGEFRRRIPFTFIPNGDFLASSASTGWTATNATGAYVELAHPDGYYFRVLQNTASGTDGRLTSTTLKVAAGDTWYFYTFNRVTTAGDIAELVIYDETNSAEITQTVITGDSTYSGLSFQDLLVSVVIPTSATAASDCTQISVRLQSTASGDVSQWGPVSAAPWGTMTYTGQTFLEYLKRVEKLWTFTCGNYGPQGRSWQELQWGRHDDQFGWGQGFTFDSAPPFPLYADVLLAYPALTAGDPTSAGSGSAASESDTTACPESLVLAGMAVEFAKWAQREERRKRGPDADTTRWDAMLENAEAALITAQSDWNAPKTITVRKHHAGPAIA